MPRINWDTVPEAGEFEVIPEGEYHCRLLSAEETTSKNGNEMWNLTWVIIAGEHTNQRIFDRLVFDGGKAQGRVKLLFKRCGAGELTGDMDIDPSMIVGRECMVSVHHEIYDGTTRSRVPFAGYMYPPEPSAKLPTETKPKAPARTSTKPDDDIPF